MGKRKLLTLFSTVLMLVYLVLPTGHHLHIDAAEQNYRIDGEQRINAGDLKWTPVSKENPLGGADDFNAILFDHFSNFNETGGAVAAGTVDNVGIITFEEGFIGGINHFDDYTIPRYNIGTIVQNDIPNNKVRVSNGDAIIGDDVAEEKIDKTPPEIIDEGSVFVDQAQIDSFMSDAKTDLTNLNQQLWNTSTTASSSESGNDVTLDVQSGVNVFEVDTSGKINININYDENAKDSTIIIKATSDIVEIKSTTVNGVAIANQNIDSIVNRILWVFDPNVNEINVNNSELWIGSVLAPNADFYLNEGYSSINGTIIANSLDASNGSTNSEFHYTGRFMGELPKEEAPGEVCEEVEVTVKEDDKPSSDKTYTLVDEEGKEVEFTTDENGQATVGRDELPEGNYTVADAEGNEVGKVEVGEDCKVEVKVELSEKVCEEVEITVTEDGNPSSDKTYKLVDKEGNEVVGITTDKNGQATVDRDELPEGDYEVVDEKDNKVGDVSVDKDCVVEVNVTPTDGTPGNVCEEVEVTVTEDGNPSSDKTYTLIDEEEKELEIATDENGQATVGRDELPEGNYTVADEEGNEVGKVEVGEDCEVEVKVEQPEEETPGDNCEESPGQEECNEGENSEDPEGPKDPEEPLKETTIVNPEVIQAVCGKSDEPKVILPKQKGVIYTIDGKVEQGNTVKVIAEAQTGHELELIDGWTWDEAKGYAYKLIELDEINCDSDVVIEDEDQNDKESPKQEEGKELPKTATHSFNLLLAGFILVGLGLLTVTFSRRRNA